MSRYFDFSEAAAPYKEVAENEGAGANAVHNVTAGKASGDASVSIARNQVTGGDMVSTKHLLMLKSMARAHTVLLRREPHACFAVASGYIPEGHSGGYLGAILKIGRETSRSLPWARPGVLERFIFRLPWTLLT